MQVKIKMQMVVCLTVMAIALLPQSEAVVSCDQLRNNLGSCLGFLRGSPITQPCCNGVRAVAASATTTRDRRAACQCLVAAARNLRGTINFGNAARLPAACGVAIPFQISPNTNCARVH